MSESRGVDQLFLNDVEGEVLEKDLALANGVFRWLQQTNEEIVQPPLNEMAHGRLSDVFQMEPDNLPELRILINSLSAQHILPLRLYISGFDDWIVRQVDAEEILNVAAFELTERCRELFHEPESMKEGPEPSPPAIVHDIAVAREGLRQKVAKETSPASPPPAPSRSPQPPTPPLGAATRGGGILELFLLDGSAGEKQWQERALCAQTDPESFFPDKGGSTREAKKVCQSCEVRDDCLQAALDNDERFGIWGGLSERERRKLKKRAV